MKFSIALTILIVLSIWYDFKFRYSMRFDAVGLLPRNSKKIYLTYDDGPSVSPCSDETSAISIDEKQQPIVEEGTTYELLRVLKTAGVGAVFFLRADVIEKNIVARSCAIKIAEEGHIVGNHSYSHMHSDRVTSDYAVEDMRRGHDVISGSVGVKINIFRPPYGVWSFGLTRKAWKIRELSGYELPIGWTWATRDWELDGCSEDTKKMSSKIDELFELVKTRGAQVILQHDTRKYSVEFTRMLLEKIKERDDIEIGEPKDLVARVRVITMWAKRILAIEYYLRGRVRDVINRFGN